MTRGALYSSFRTRDELFAALFRRESARDLARAAEQLAGIEDEVEPVTAAVDRCLTTFRADRTWTLVLTEYQLHAARSPAAAVTLREHTAAVLDGITALVEDTARRAGVGLTVPAASLARMVVALHDDLVIGSFAGPAGGASSQLVLVAPEGASVGDPEYAPAVRAAVAAAGEVPQVAAVLDPFATRAVSPDGRAALVTVTFDVAREEVDPETRDALEEVATTAQDAGLDAAAGGEVFGTTGVRISATEFIGVGVAVLVLVVTFGSLLAAGMNLLTALVGIGVGLGGLLAVSGAITLSSTAPTPALMIGLAVGILIDAIVVRMTLVPAVLALLGRSAWWLPRRLDRLVPDVDVEGARLGPATPATPQRELAPAAR